MKKAFVTRAALAVGELDAAPMTPVTPLDKNESSQSRNASKNAYYEDENPGNLKFGWKAKIANAHFSLVSLGITKCELYGGVR